MLSAVIAALLQVVVFSFIPFVVYVVRYRKARGFLRYVGLYRPEGKTLVWATLVVLISSPLLLWVFSTPGLREMATGPATTVGVLRSVGLGPEVVLLLLLFAWIQTALAEEILFRGFVAQRLISRLGFTWGNLVQATIFGLIHLALFLMLAGQTLTPMRSAALFLVPGLIGWLLGYLKVRLGNGSILPGWWAHGLANCIAYTVMAFYWT